MATELVATREMRAFPPLTEASIEDEFVVFCTIETHHMSFVVLEVAGGSPDGGGVLFTKRDADSPTTFAENLGEAQVFVYGWLKWDGCADLTVGTGQDYQLHFCGRRSALILQRVMERLYDIAAAHMECFNAELAS